MRADIGNLDDEIASLQLSQQSDSDTPTSPFSSPVTPEPEPGPTGMLKALSTDAISHIVRFLYVDEYLRVEQLSRHSRALLGPRAGISRVYWAAAFAHHVTMYLRPERPTPSHPTHPTAATTTAAAPDLATCTHHVSRYPVRLACPRARSLLTHALRILRLTGPRSAAFSSVSSTGSDPLYSLLQVCAAVSP